MAMVGISDIANDPVNFRSREAGNPDGVPPKRVLTGVTETQLYGSSWNPLPTRYPARLPTI